MREMSFSSRGVRSLNSFGYLCSHPVSMVAPMQASGTRRRSRAARHVTQLGTIASPSASGKQVLHANKPAMGDRISSVIAFFQSVRAGAGGGGGGGRADRGA